MGYGVLGTALWAMVSWVPLKWVLGVKRVHTVATASGAVEGNSMGQQSSSCRSKLHTACETKGEKQGC